MPEFSAELAAILERKRWSHAAYAKKLGYHNNGSVTGVIAKQRPPPLDQIDRWLDALELPATERERLYRLAMRQYAPRYVVDILDHADDLRRERDAIIALFVKIFRLDPRFSPEGDAGKALEDFFRRNAVDPDSPEGSMLRNMFVASILGGQLPASGIPG